MITTEGSLHIKRYLAGMVPAIAQSIAFGVGTRAEALTDTDLQFETERVDIVLTSYDFVDDRLIFKAEVPDDFAGTFYEAALYSLPSAITDSSRMLTSFDSDTELWTTNSAGPTFTTTNARIGADSLNHTPAASATSTSVLSDILLDLSDYSAGDYFNLAFNNANSNVSTVAIRLKTDASNYYTLTVNAPSTGYQFASVTKGSATVTGSPDWANITSIEVATTSKSAGASNIDFDGLRIEDVDTINPDYVLVARELMTTPFVKKVGMIQEVEFSLDVTAA